MSRGVGRPAPSLPHSTVTPAGRPGKPGPGEIADGRLGTSFVPEGAKEAYFDHLDRGLAAVGRTRADLDICQGAEVAFADDEDALRVMVAGRKKELAFSLGGMGSATGRRHGLTGGRAPSGAADEDAEKTGDEHRIAGTGQVPAGSG